MIRIFNNILDKLDIEYMRDDIKEEKIIRYICDYKDTDGDGFRFTLAINKKYKIFGLFSTPIIKVEESRRLEVLELINKINTKIIYGQLYIDEDEDLVYHIGASLEGENPINYMQINDYVTYMYSCLKEVTVASTEVASTHLED